MRDIFFQRRHDSVSSLKINAEMLRFLLKRLQIKTLSTHVFETRTATGREHFEFQGSGVCDIFILIISNGEKILGNVDVVV